MRYRYIALVGNVNQPDAGGSPGVAAALADMGMRERLSSNLISLHATQETPTLVIPGGGIVIGDLYSATGTRISDQAQLPDFADQAQIRKYMLQNCWGDYLLVQPATDGRAGFTIMRDPAPSSDLPCLYSLRDGCGFITSDTSLAVHLGVYRERINWDFMTQCLIHPHLKAEKTGLVGIHELLPGCSLTLLGTNLSTALAWCPWDFVSLDRRHSDPRDAAAEIRSAVSLVVETWASEDQAVLLELSGGLDSSIVGACLRKTTARVVCSTLTTPVPGADERSYACLITQLLGVGLNSEALCLEGARFNFPLPVHSVAPRMGLLQSGIDTAMEAAANRHDVNSYFSGSGGDTVFCYLTTAAPAADAFREAGWMAGVAAIRDLSDLHQCTAWKAGRLTVSKLLRAPRPSLKTDVSFLSLGSTEVHAGTHPWFSAPSAALAGDRERVCDLAGTQVFRDNSPRGWMRRRRMPLLSQPVVEACLKAPSWMWIAGGQNRAVVRAAFSDSLPPQILNRRSKGNFLSYLGAVYRRNKLQMLDFLLTGHLHAHGLLDSTALSNYVTSDPAPADPSFIRLYDLCMIENWIRQKS